MTSKLKQILDKINQIQTRQRQVKRKLLEIDDLIIDIEKLFNLSVKAGDLITAIKLAQNTVNVLEMAKEFTEEETKP